MDCCDCIQLDLGRHPALGEGRKTVRGYLNGEGEPGLRARAVARPVGPAHLIEAMDQVMRRLGGAARTWRTDRLATVIVRGTRDVQPSSTVAVGIPDRLLHRSVVFNIDGDSYRMRAHRARSVALRKGSGGHLQQVVSAPYTQEDQPGGCR